MKLGCKYCFMHLPLLVMTLTRTVDALVLYIDFETSGLDVVSDHSSLDHSVVLGLSVGRDAAPAPPACFAPQPLSLLIKAHI